MVIGNARRVLVRDGTLIGAVLIKILLIFEILCSFISIFILATLLFVKTSANVPACAPPPDPQCIPAFVPPDVNI